MEHKMCQWVYFAYAGTYSTTPVLVLILVFLTCRNCFFDKALSVEDNFPRLSCFADFCACLNSFSARLFSFSSRLSFLTTLDCRRSSRSSDWSSNDSFLSRFSFSLSSKDFTWLFTLVLIKVDARFWGRTFQDLPDTLRPFFGTSLDICTISPLITVFSSTGTGSSVRFPDGTDMIWVDELWDDKSK